MIWPSREAERTMTCKAAIVEMTPVGWVRSSRRAAVDDDWDSVAAEIELDGDRFTADALTGLHEFSHVEVIFVFDQLPLDEVTYGARHPRGNPLWPTVGIFAQRARYRPNRLGSTVCRILAVRGLIISLVGLDAIDGTPVLDLKPYMEEFGPRGRIYQPEWSHLLMAEYWSTPGTPPRES